MASSVGITVGERFLRLLRETQTEELLERFLDFFTTKEYNQILEDGSLATEDFSNILHVEKFEQYLYSLISYLRRQSTCFEKPGGNLDLINEVTANLFKILVILTHPRSPRKNQMITRLTDAKVPQIIGKVIQDHHQRYIKNEKLQTVVRRAFSFIENSVTLRDVRQKLADQTAEALKAFLDPEGNLIDIAVKAIVLVDNLCPAESLSVLYFSSALFTEISGALQHTVYAGDEENFKVGHSYKTVLESALLCLLALDKSPTYHCQLILILKDSSHIIKDILRRGKPDLKLAVTNLLEVLNRQKCDKCDGHVFVRKLHSEFPTLRSQDVGPDASRLISDDSSLEKSTELGGYGCAYQKMCRTFLMAHINEQYVTREHDRCFCDNCMKSRGDRMMYNRGEPPKSFFVPQGWAKFSLRPPPRANVFNIWENWHVGFYGTSARNIKTVLENGDLLLSAKGPRGYGTTIKVFPNVESSCTEIPVEEKQFREGGATYQAQAAFQVRIKPDAYTESDNPSNLSESMWMTTSKGSVILTGVLVKLTLVSDIPTVAHTPQPKSKGGFDTECAERLSKIAGVFKAFPAYDSRLSVHLLFCCVLYDRKTPELKNEMKNRSSADGPEVKYMSSIPNREAQAVVYKQVEHRKNTPEAKSYRSDQMMKMTDVINKHSNDLFRRHTNLSVIKPDRVKSKRFDSSKAFELHLEQCPCIVFYVRKKHIIPVGEKSLPSELGGFPTDVREGLYLPAGDEPPHREMRTPQSSHQIVLHPGCGVCSDSNKCGTLGGFVRCKLTGKRGFLTSYHLFIHELAHQSNQSPSPGDSVFYVGDRVSYRPGRVTCAELSPAPNITKRLIFGNKTVDNEEYGMDVVFAAPQKHAHCVSTLTTNSYEVDFIRTNFEELSSCEQLRYSATPISPSEIEDQGTVFKYGNQTELTEGIFDSSGMCVSDWFNSGVSSFRFQGHNLISIRDPMPRSRAKSAVFADNGDSGSFAFIVRENRLRVFGIVAGKLSDGTHMVMPIDPILKVMKLDLKSNELDL